MGIFGAVEINLKIKNSRRTKEVLHNVDAKITYHRSIVVWIEPTPMWRSSVVIVQDPLCAFKVLFQHLFLFGLTLVGLYVEVNFGLIVELLS